MTSSPITRIAWKAFWIPLAAVVAVAVAAVPTLLDLSTLVRVLTSVSTAVLIGLLFVHGTKLVVHRSKMFQDLVLEAQRQVVRWVTLAVCADVVWVTAFALDPQSWVVWAVALLAIVLIEYWVARALEYLLTRLKPVREVTQIEQAPARPTVMTPDGVREMDDYEQKFTQILRMAKLGWLLLLGYRGIGEPKPFGVVVMVRRPSYARAVKTGKGKGATGELTQADAEAIAIALQEATGVEMMSDFVQLQKAPQAGTYSITIVVEDVMARVYPYLDPPGYFSIKQPAPIGYAIDGTMYTLPLKQHGQAIGSSTAGKSSLLHVIIAYVTACPDAVLWICGTQKLYDLVAGWLECYMDSDLPLPIDWVANGMADVLEMQRAAMNVARYRQAVPMAQRGNWPTVIAIMDEASFPLGNPELGIEFEGRLCTSSKMAEHNNRGANSGDVHWIYASQRSTNGDFGDNGGDATANIGWSAAFLSGDQAETGRLTGDYSLPMPRHKGQFWLKANDGQMPTNLKAPYLQTVDPSKPVLHDGLTVADVARSRAELRRFGSWELDAGSAQAAGPAYRNRHRRMNAAMQAYLMGHDVTPAQLQTGTAGPAEVAPSGPASGADGVSKGYVAGAGAGLDLLAKMGLPVLGPDGAVIDDPATGSPAAAAGADNGAQGQSGPVSEPTGEPGVRVEGAFFYGPGEATPGGVATLAGRRTRGDRVIDILTKAEAPMARGDLLAELRKGEEVGEQVLTNLLKKLVDTKRIERVDDGYQVRK